MIIKFGVEFQSYTNFLPQVHVEGLTVGDCLEKLFDRFPQLYVHLLKDDYRGAKATGIRLNGEYIWEATALHTAVGAEDELELTRDVPEGSKGGGLTQILVGLGIVALTLATGGLGSTAGGWAFTAAAEGARQGLTFAGSLVLGLGMSLTLSGLSQVIAGAPNLPTYDNKDNSATYSFSGIKNTTAPGTTLNVVYGTNRVGGHIVNAFTTASGNANYLNALLGVSEGPINQIVLDSIELNNRKITDYPSSDTSVEWRLGDRDQEGVRKLFESTRDLVTVNIPDEHITKGDSYTFVLPHGDIDQVGVEYHINSAAFTDQLDKKLTVTKIETQTGRVLQNFKTYFKKRDGTFYISTAGNSQKTIVLKSEKNLDITIKSYNYMYEGGTPAPVNSAVISWFSNIESTTAVNVKLPYDNTIETLKTNISDGLKQTIINELDGSTYTTSVIVSSLRVSISAPALYKSGPEGIEKTTVVAHVYYKKQDDENYNMTPVIVTLQDKTKSEVIVSADIPITTPGIYTIKAVRFTTSSTSIQIANDVYLKDVTEILNDQFIYPHTALMGLRVKASEQLSGSMPNITSVIEGVKVFVPENYDGYNRKMTSTWTGALKAVREYTNNPVWCLYDLLTNTRYGLGDYFKIDESKRARLLNNFQAMAVYCDQRIRKDGTVVLTSDPDAADYDSIDYCRFNLDLVLDGSRDAIEWLNTICAVMRATLYYSEGLLVLDIARPKVMTQLFTMSNIVKGSFKQVGGSYKAIPNAYEVQFANVDKDYELDLFRIESKDLQTDSSIEERKQNLNLIGVTRIDQAKRLAKYALAVGENNLTTVTFSTGTEGLLSSVGDVVGVQHDVPQWGYGGRVVSYNSSSKVMVLSGEVEFKAGHTYSVKLAHKGGIPEVYGVVEQAAGAVTSTVTLTSDSGTYSALTFTPTHDDIYVIGETTNEVKPFEIKSLKRSPDEQVELVCIEYNESVFDLSDNIINISETPEVNYSQLEDPSAIESVTNFKVSDKLTLTSSGEYWAGIEIYYTPPTSSYYRGANIYYASEGSTNYQLLSFDTTGHLTVDSIKTPGKYIFIATSVYSTRTQSVAEALDDLTAVPFVVFDVQPFKSNPDFIKGVRGLKVDNTPNNTTFAGKDCRFNWFRTNPIIANTDLPVDSETNGAGTGLNHSWFKSYNIEILNLDGSVRRTVTTREEAFTYTHEMNHQDGVVNREFKFRITQSDKLGRTSNPVEVSVINEAPAAPSNVVVSALVGAIDVSFSPSADLDVAGYIIYGSQSSADLAVSNLPENLVLNRGPETSKLVTSYKVAGVDTAIPSGTWYIKVAVYDTFGEDLLNYSSVYSVVVPENIVDTIPPAVPSGLNITSGGIDNIAQVNSAYILAQWNANTEDDFERYMLRVRKGAQSSYTEYTASAAATSFKITGLFTGTSYSVSIAGVDKFGNASDWSAEVTATTASDTTAPATVTGLSATATFRSIFLSWVAPADKDLSHYLVYRNTTNSSDSAVEIGHIAGQNTKWIDTGLATGSTYYYWLKSVDFSGNVSGLSSGVNATTVAAVAVDLDMQIGGGNLCPNSSFEADSDGNGLADGWAIYNNSAGLEPATASRTTGLYGSYAQRISWSVNNTTSKGITRLWACTGGWRADATYIVSFEVKASGTAIGKTMELKWNTAPAVVTALSNPALTSDWQRYIFKVTWGASVEASGSIFLTVQYGVSCQGTLDFDAVQVELGDVATAYAPKPDEILPSTITATEIADNAVTNLKIAAAAVTAAKTSIAALNSTTGNLNINTVSTDQLVSDAVTTVKIATDAITSPKIFAGAITTNKIAANAVTANEIAANSITTAKLVAGAVTTNELAANAVTAEKITAGTITAVQIAADTITSANIAANAITATELATDSVTAGKIAAGAVVAGKIAAGAVTANEIAANTITAAKIAANTITATEIAAEAITVSELAADSVSTAKIQAGAVTADEIAASAVTTVKLNAGAVTADKITVTSLSAITGNVGTLTSGLIQSSNWGTSAGSQIDLTNSVVKLGGSSAPKFHFDGTNLTITGSINITGGQAAADIAAAGTTANWSGVSGTGKPVDFASAGPSICRPVTAWENLNGQSIVTVMDGKVGDKVLRLTGPGAYPNEGRYFPIDRTKTYRTRFWARCSADNTAGLLYFSLRQFVRNPDGTYSAGPTNQGRAPYKPNGVSASGAYQPWTEFSFTWAAADWQGGVTHVLPEFLNNYPAAAGYWDIQDFEFLEVSEVTAAQSTANTAVSNAAAAQSSATTANNLLADLASDSKLTAAEKQQIKVEWDGIVAEKPRFDTQADAFSITTEKTNYGTSYTTLSNYITPLLSSLTTTSDIVGTTFRANFTDYYDKRQLLLNKIASEAGLRASWSGVTGTGKPENNATAGSINLLVDPAFTKTSTASDSTHWSLNGTTSAWASNYGFNGSKPGVRLNFAGASTYGITTAQSKITAIGDQKFYCFVRYYVSKSVADGGVDAGTYNGTFVQLAFVHYDKDNSVLGYGSYPLSMATKGAWVTATFSMEALGNNAVTSVQPYLQIYNATAGFVAFDYCYISTAEYNATVGAPSGTLVGSTLAQTVESNAGRAASGLDSSGFVSKVIQGVKLPSTGMATGLNITSSYLGYYDGSNWKSYLGSNGDFKLGDGVTPGTKGLTWNQAAGTLAIRGSLVADDMTTGTLNATNVNITNFSADSIVAGALRSRHVNAGSHTTKGSYLTASCTAGATTLTLHNVDDFALAVNPTGTGWIIDSTNDRDAFSYTGVNTGTKTLTGVTGVLAHSEGVTVIPARQNIVIDEKTNEFRFYGDRGDGTIAELANIGVSVAGDYVLKATATSISAINGNSSSGAGVRGISDTSDGCRGYSSSGKGVLGWSSSGDGLHGYSLSGYGASLAANLTKGHMFLEPVTLLPSGRAAGAITLLQRTDDTYRLCFADGTKWHYVGDNTIVAGYGN
jgi:predicted phage tail protein